MSLRSLSCYAVLILGMGLLSHAAPLRICADPDNLPFSNRAARGFDNQIAALVARDLHREPVFVWSRNGRGFLREQFNRNACDVLVGVPQKLRGVLTTAPYYRSAYVFVTRRQDNLQIASFSDPHLNGPKIGLQALEDNLSPPSLALIRTGHAAQLVGFNSFGANGPAILRAVVNRRLGTAVVWGPLAGYWITHERLPLNLTPVSPLVDPSGVPFAFSISMAVHKHDEKLRADLNAALIRLRPSISRVLASYNVPTLAEEAQ
ncbi:quinoprotein dehydrogenase-associated putative ABC transporter substrate-binding protein [Occallatibacter savannae]|uniref:quinoprotein dehydrogenase-associated putative ABC transporter substrate-binding protein n=1 Tax=Occallatibacter savannae TaxID=1002691 RepID=UPI000D69CD85|nr:quinoprotein dehydrogenase-associated putative ABC transporter substrate-binding protein [Occallatibacter savannae]